MFLPGGSGAAASNPQPAELHLDQTRRQCREGPPQDGGAERGRRTQEYLQARETVVLAHLELVLQIIRRCKWMGLSREDLIQEGMLGLLRAADLYDARRGCRFATYAKWWVREAIMSALALLMGPCRIPVPLLLLRSRLRATGRQFLQDLQRAPSLQELALAAGVSRRTAIRACCLGRAAQSGGEPERFEDFAAPAPGPDLDLMEHQGRRIRRALGSIGERERTVVESRFGLRGRPPQTCRTLGTELGVSHERVRQIEKAALQKLRKFLESRGEDADWFDK